MAPSRGQEPETGRWLVRQADNTNGIEPKSDSRQLADQQTLTGKAAHTVAEQQGVLRPMHLRKIGRERQEWGKDHPRSTPSRRDICVLFMVGQDDTIDSPEAGA